MIAKKLIIIFRIVYYLMNIKVVPRTIYLSRHGQSHYNSLKKLGGDSDLTDCGEEYSRSDTLTSNFIVVHKNEV